MQLPFKVNTRAMVQPCMHSVLWGYILKWDWDYRSQVGEASGVVQSVTCEN